MTHKIKPPRYITWSTDSVDLDDPFQRKWYITQVLLNGRSQDIRNIDFDELTLILDELHLPKKLYNFWKTYLEYRFQANLLRENIS